MIRLSILVAAALAAVWSTGVLASDTNVGDIIIVEPWARASADAAKTGAAYMTLRNGGAAADRLVKAFARVADRVELHTHQKEGDVMRMRAVEAIDIPAGGAVELRPGSFHVMFIGLHAPFKKGESFPLTLTFEKAGNTTVNVVIEGAAATGPVEMEGHYHE